MKILLPHIQRYISFYCPTPAVPQPRRNYCPLVAVESLHNCETLDWKCCCGYWFDIYPPADKLTSCTCLTDHRASCWAGWRQKWLFRVKAGMCLWWCLFQRQRHFLSLDFILFTGMQLDVSEGKYWFDDDDKIRHFRSGGVVGDQSTAFFQQTLLVSPCQNVPPSSVLYRTPHRSLQ